MRVPGIAVLSLLALMTISVVPASADRPVRSDEPVFFVFRDPENRLGVLANITRDNACAWEAGGFEGQPPVDELLSVQFKETGQGEVVLSYHAEVSIEIWQLDDTSVDLCELIDGPWATGTGRIGFTDNDAFAIGARTSSFGGHVQATVVDGDGATWRYSSSGRFQGTKDGEFVVRAEHFTLTKQGGIR
jgi:hypothetical protein